LRPLATVVDTRHVYDRVFNIYVPIAIGVFVLFLILIVGAVLVYRRNDRASRRHEANLLEGSYAVLLTLVAAFLLYITFSAEHRDDLISNSDSAASHRDTLERPAVTIDVIGARWDWTFKYVGHNITHESGAVGDQPLVVPTNEPIRFNITSDDVIHSFWIPELDFKHDAFPGSVQSVTLVFDQAGTFSGSCAEYCGLLHSYMVFTVHALAPARFGAWLQSGGRTST
jgi:cytochrome c oxidase subunit 2